MNQHVSFVSTLATYQLYIEGKHTQIWIVAPIVPHCWYSETSFLFSCYKDVYALFSSFWGMIEQNINNMQTAMIPIIDIITIFSVLIAYSSSFIGFILKWLLYGMFVLINVTISSLNVGFDVVPSTIVKLSWSVYYHCICSY